MYVCMYVCVVKLGSCAVVTTSSYAPVVCTLTWKNGFAECVEFILIFNQSINLLKI